MLAHEPAKAAPERQARDARRRDHASRRRETMELRFTVELVPREAPLRAGGAGLRIDVNALHERQVDHQAAVDRRAPRDVVTASPDGDFELSIARHLHGIGDVGQTAAAGDERRPLVDETVMDLPGFVITCVARAKELSGERAGERGHHTTPFPGVRRCTSYHSKRPASVGGTCRQRSSSIRYSLMRRASGASGLSVRYFWKAVFARSLSFRW